MPYKDGACHVTIYPKIILGQFMSKTMSIQSVEMYFQSGWILKMR